MTSSEYVKLKQTIEIQATRRAGFGEGKVLTAAISDWQKLEYMKERTKQLSSYQTSEENGE